MRSLLTLILLALLPIACTGLASITPSQPAAPEAPVAAYQVLVFHKAAGFVHESIPAGVAALQRLGRANGFGVVTTDDAAAFTTEDLGTYAAIVFLNTTGDFFDAAQQGAFEAYIQGGGGFVGIHGASSAEYEWAWYGGLIGAYFDRHPEVQEATVLVTDRQHPSTAHLPLRWTRTDEWYDFRANPRDSVHVLAALDVKSYAGGEMTPDHPIAWAHRYDGGRAWYTGMGHTAESYSEPLFMDHLLGGIEWAAGVVEAGVGATLASHYETVVLMDEVTDPMELAIASDGRVLMVERFGAVKLWDPRTQAVTVAGWIAVNKTIEDGLMGITLDPSFDDTGWLYVYYAPADGGPQRLSRMTLVNNRLDPASEKILLEITIQRKYCCHSAGSLTFDPQGNLYLSTGDNSGGPPVGTSIDERPDRAYTDVQRSSANANDLRGKILRITPQPDGTYTIPEGNLFPPGTPGTRPEVYTMGHRNPFRISIDPATGDLFWGDVGSGRPPSEHGTWGWDEFNRAQAPGFFGWPYFVGPNDAYRDYDFATETLGPPFDPAHPINDSPNNTGIQELPPSQPALIWYTYGMSEEFPEMGAGGINPMAGPLYRYDAATASPQGLPPYYDGKWIIYEWMRHWVQVVSFDADGEVLKIDPFLPGLSFVSPMDVELGPDGRLYVIEWGDEFWGSNHNARVVRIDYRATDQPPMAGHAPPHPAPETPTVALTAPADGSFFDYDTPVPYHVTTNGQDVTVRTYTGFDTYALPLDTLAGPEGAFTITRAYTHVPDMYLMDRFATVEACAKGRTGREACTRVKLHPRRMEAEHFSSKEGAVRHTYGTHPASEGYAATAHTTMKVRNGHHITYTPINLTGIDSLTVRLQAHAEGTLTLRLDALDGPVVATLPFAPGVGRPVRLPQSDAIEAMLAAGMQSNALDAKGYEGWHDLTVPLTPSSGTHTLFLTFTANTDAPLAEVDGWMVVGLE